jgi:hypothetical protein
LAGDRGLEARVPPRLTRAEGRHFGLVVGTAFLILAAILLWRRRETVSAVAAVIGILLVTGAIVIPGRLGPVQRAWMKLAHVISRFTTPLFMGLLFFVVITPAGLLARAFGHRPLTRARRGSAWVDRTGPQGRRSDLTHQF